MESLGSLCVGAILFIGLLLAWWLLRKLLGTREPPAGTYDKKEIQSGGSIGGQRGGRSYDHPDFDSGGTIGGDRERRAHDHPDIGSGGSIGGGPSVGDRPGSSGDTGGTGGWEIGGDELKNQAAPREDGGRVDHPDIKSGGSFGG
jgi:hypothetical protein